MDIMNKTFSRLILSVLCLLATLGSWADTESQTFVDAGVYTFKAKGTSYYLSLADGVKGDNTGYYVAHLASTKTYLTIDGSGTSFSIGNGSGKYLGISTATQWWDAAITTTATTWTIENTTVSGTEYYKLKCSKGYLGSDSWTTLNGKLYDNQQTESKMMLFTIAIDYSRTLQNQITKYTALLNSPTVGQPVDDANGTFKAAIDAAKAVTTATEADVMALNAAYQTFLSSSNLYLPEGYYYMKNLNTDSRPPYIFNAFQYSNNTNDYTLQSSTKVTGNSGIWHVVNNGDNITITNGQGQGVNTDKGKYTKLNFVAANGNDGIAFTQHPNATNGGRTVTDNGTTYNYLTTWTDGGASAMDNRWSFETAAASSTIYKVVITGYDNGYVQYGTQYARNGGFFSISSTPGKSSFTPWTDARHTATVTVDATNKIINVAYTSLCNISFVIMDESGNEIFRETKQNQIVGNTVTCSYATPLYTAYSHPLSVTATSEDKTIYSTISADGLPFTLSSSYDDGVWYDENGSTDKAYAYTGTPWTGIKRYTYGDSETVTDVALSTIQNTKYSAHTFSGPFTVTYVYKHNGETWYTEKHANLNLGEAYPSPTQPYGVTVSAPTGTVSVSRTVNLECTVNYPFSFYNTYSADNDWYTLSISNSKYLFNYSSSATTYMTLSATSIPTSGADNYHFQFVGNPYEGFKIYNKGAGSAKILCAIDPATDTKDSKKTGGGAYILMRNESGLSSTYNTTWDLAVSTTNSSGFFLRRHGQTYSANCRGDMVSGSNVLSFWTGGADAGSTVYIMSSTQQSVSTNPTTATPTTGKIYRIYNCSGTGHMLYNNGNTLGATNVKTVGDYTQMWLLESTTSGDVTTWKLRSCSNGNQICNSSSKTTAMTLASSGGTFYLVASTDGTSYAISPAADPTSTEINMNWYNDSKIAGWSWTASHGETGSEWVFEEVAETEATIDECKAAAVASSVYAEVAAGKIFTFYNLGRGALMNQNYLNGKGVVVTNSPDSPYSQYWKLTGADNSFALQNVLTGQYLQSPPRSSVTSVGSDPVYFTFATITNEWDKPAYTIRNGDYLHADASWNVVGWWEGSISGSEWKVKEITLTDAQINQIASQYQDYSETYATYQNYKNNEENYTGKLYGKYFSDYACTTLTSTYTSKTAAELQSDMEADELPEPIITMALKVRNDSWEQYVDGNEKLNEKFFRVQDYQIYSNESTWCGLLGASNARGRWSNPVGVVIPKSETAFVYVDQDIPTGATLQIDGIRGTDTGCRSWSLHKGVNVIQTTEIDRLYVYYMMDNTDKDGNLQYLSSFPKMRVHIEGGYVNGYWDETRDMDNADWTAMVSSDKLLQYGYLDIKGKYMCMLMNAPIVKSVCPTRIADIMRVWNHIVRTEYEVLGVYYKPNDFGDRFNNLMNGFSVTYNYMYASTWGGWYNESTLSTIMNPDVMTRGGGNLWGPAHEMGHNNQAAMNMIGCTEISNNVFSNAVVWQWGTTTTRGASAQETFNKFSQGQCWYERGLWERTRLYYQLWQYFYVCRHDTAFYPKLYRKLIADPMKHPGYCFTPAADDELHFAEAVCEVAQMDLTEFFETYGFFKKPTLTSYTLNGTTKDAFLVGDYSNYYVTFDSDTQTWDEQVAATKKKLAAYTNKAGTNLMFIEDRVETTVSDERTANPGTTRADYEDDVAVGKCGDVGSFTQFTEEAQAASDAGKYFYLIDGTTLAMVGSGAVGYKIYDADGNLVQLSSSNTFTVSSEIAAGLADGTYKLDVAESDGTSVELTDELNEANKKAASLGGVEVGKNYRLRNLAVSSHYMTMESGDLSSLHSETVVASDRYSLWTVEKASAADTYYIKNVMTGRYVAPVPTTGGSSWETGDGVYGQGVIVPMVADKASAGTYKFTYNTIGFNINNTNPANTKATYLSLHDGGSGAKVVRWLADSNNSKWLCEYMAPDGDVDNDGRVTVADLSALVGYLGGGTKTITNFNTGAADVNQDGTIDIKDITTLSSMILK